MVYVCAYFNVYVCVFENVRIASCGEREKYHRIVHVLYSYFDCKRSPVAQWIKGWPTDLAAPSSSPAQGEIFSTVNGVPLQTTFFVVVVVVLLFYVHGKHLRSCRGGQLT